MNKQLCKSCREQTKKEVKDKKMTLGEIFKLKKCSYSMFCFTDDIEIPNKLMEHCPYRLEQMVIEQNETK
jgi:hypothetical protein